LPTSAYSPGNRQGLLLFGMEDVLMHWIFSITQHAHTRPIRGNVSHCVVQNATVFRVLAGVAVFSLSHRECFDDRRGLFTGGGASKQRYVS
jgi:hypothetical protein